MGGRLGREKQFSAQTATESNRLPAALLARKWPQQEDAGKRAGAPRQLKEDHTKRASNALLHHGGCPLLTKRGA